MNILWVDDEPDNIEYIQEALIDEGHKVDVANTIEAAISALESDAYNAILLDQQMALPIEIMDHESYVWAGVIVLRWLRGNGKSFEGMLPGVKKLLDDYIADREVKSANKNIRVAICSAFYDPKVIKVLRASSDSDSHIKIMLKPLDIDEIFKFINAIR